jgi:hypothetical protein
VESAQGQGLPWGNEMLELMADIESEAGRPGLKSGWRGLLDFGEVWTESDADLWPSVSGKVPLGDSLMWGASFVLSPKTSRAEPSYSCGILTRPEK